MTIAKIGSYDTNLRNQLTVTMLITRTFGNLSLEPFKVYGNYYYIGSNACYCKSSNM